ncbi:hypothetical protein [Kitasatospora sp. GAS1066B]|uniref:hypothetical protein n=1 Tax=Kitasatospora sp. GAS1066B TaxID=3156271 RepID=UPI00351755BE
MGAYWNVSTDRLTIQMVHASPTDLFCDDSTCTPDDHPAVETTVMACPQCDYTAELTILGEWGQPARIQCHRCGHAFNAPMSESDSIRLLQRAIAASITGGNSTPPTTIWKPPQPRLTELIHPVLDEARACIASGLWILSPDILSHVETLLDQLNWPSEVGLVTLPLRVDWLQGAVVALYEHRGSTNDFGKWLYECGQVLAPAMQFVVDGGQPRAAVGQPSALTDAEEALGMVRAFLYAIGDGAAA